MDWPVSVIPRAHKGENIERRRAKFRENFGIRSRDWLYVCVWRSWWTLAPGIKLFSSGAIERRNPPWFASACVIKSVRRLITISHTHTMAGRFVTAHCARGDINSQIRQKALIDADVFIRTRERDLRPIGSEIHDHADRDELFKCFFYN